MMSFSLQMAVQYNLRKKTEGKLIHFISVVRKTKFLGPAIIPKLLAANKKCYQLSNYFEYMSINSIFLMEIVF